MDIITSVIALAIAAWSIHCICTKRQKLIIKILKSILSAWFFLAVAGAGINDKQAGASIIVMIIGAGIQHYFNNRMRKASKEKTHQELAHKVNTVTNDPNRSHYRKKNYAKGKSATDFKNIAFSYTNSSGESSFRDVDVKSFDGSYIEGYCHKSRAFKTFRLDRIDGDIIIRDTGESLTTSVWASSLLN